MRCPHVSGDSSFRLYISVFSIKQEKADLSGQPLLINSSFANAKLKSLNNLSGTAVSEAIAELEHEIGRCLWEHTYTIHD